MRSTTIASSLAVLASLVRAADPVWPQDSDFFEDLLAMQGGYRRFGFTDLVVPCSHNSNIPGKQVAAEWLRTAFHDVATHDKAAGTGGLDASIFYEVARSENAGAAFNSTFNDLGEFHSAHVSAADLVALGVVAATASCGGKTIPFRTGRVDATEAGPAGVPEQDHDLKRTQDAFARMGFSNEDMITLVACGHTIGSVHGDTNPDLVAGVGLDPHAPASIATFDSTPGQFDTVVVTEYLESDGKNPLVFGTNQTTNSDARVFASDGNATMRALADPQTFQERCADAFARMIDTVPAGVRLGEPVRLYDVKPYIERLEPLAGGKVALEGSVRVRTTAGTGRDSQGIDIALNVLGGGGGGGGSSNSSTRVDASRARLRGGDSFGFLGETFSWWEFSAQMDASAAAIDGFTIEMKTTATGQVQKLDNSGAGRYPLSDELMYVGSQSCLVLTPDADDRFPVTIRAAVREELATQGAVPVLEVGHKVYTLGLAIPKIVIRKTPMTKVEGQAQGGHVLFEAKDALEQRGWSTTFDLSLEKPSGQKVVVLSRKTNSLSNSCAN
ncbi:hypothetical protein PpBr36_04177 [Pyricularia pennisetigena]|uniref:hypothetical protein n=1 Tax=Pyricularia pennisetigena TaxID=1578925 RepID=UPI001152C86F|nr:hypothetical protein PpBr36_04177 [Pyricularia pennisetigena]TLS26927.1 hypothetical protein PpBr36_04177 [Pyricularia pennisetigena]